ncbi:unnamed protein product [marine sediment metagenome]|uniref:Uncharacterized protein n=1 Tax=marine sediment metagenome TaxID=412755 RepID=X1IZD1_9ZZZZ
MKKLALLGVIIIFLITLLGSGTAMAIGPYKAIGKNPNLYDFGYMGGDALDLQTNPDGDFVQWYFNKQELCQCTDGMNPDAIESKLNAGWILWHPLAGDPRYGWCIGNEYIYKIRE